MPAPEPSGAAGLGGSRWLGALVVLLSAWTLACAEPDEAHESVARAAAASPETAWVGIGSGRFELELALDPATRFQGLSGRASIPRDGGMLFVFREARRAAMVMRDCPAPIDVAFLDDGGRIVALHEMNPEVPRHADESPTVYERRLRQYPSGAPVRFAIETAGGRFAELGVGVGDRVVFDGRALAARAR